MNHYLPPDFPIPPEAEAAFKEAFPRKKGSNRHNRETDVMREAFVLGWIKSGAHAAKSAEHLVQTLEAERAALKVREEEIHAQAALKNSWWGVSGTPEQQQEFIAGFYRARRAEPLEFKHNPPPFVDGHEAGWPTWMR